MLLSSNSKLTRNDAWVNNLKKNNGGLSFNPAASN